MRPHAQHPMKPGPAEGPLEAVERSALVAWSGHASVEVANRVTVIQGVGQHRSSQTFSNTEHTARATHTRRTTQSFTGRASARRAKRGATAGRKKTRNSRSFP